MDVFQAIVKFIADQASLNNLQAEIDKRGYTAKVKADTSQAQKAVSDLARLSQQKTMQTWANNNSKAMKIWGGQVNDIITKMGSLDKDMSKADFSNYIKQFRSIQNEAIRTGNIGKTFGDKMKTAWEKFGGWSLATKSMMLAWREFRKGIDLVKDCAITTILVHSQSKKVYPFSRLEPCSLDRHFRSCSRSRILHQVFNHGLIRIQTRVFILGKKHRIY
jgi:hypothetical protein